MATSVLARAKTSNLGRTKRRYSLTGAEHTLEEIAEVWGVTRERVRQIEANALRKLKKAFLADPLIREEAEALGLAVAEEPVAPFVEQLSFGDSFFEQIGPTVVPVAELPLAEQEAWLRDVLTKARSCARRVVEVLYFEGRSQQEASRLLRIPVHHVQLRLSSALRTVRGHISWHAKYRPICEALESLLSDPPHASSRPRQTTDPVIQALVEQKVGTTTGVELPQLLTVNSSPAAEPFIVESSQSFELPQPSLNESSTAESEVEKLPPPVEIDPPSWAAMEATAKGQSWVDTLTAKERDVLDLVLTGAISRRIAAQLDCSLRTVEGHRTSIFRKAGVTHFAALVIASVKAGLVA